jgi:tetratricopeptide (TPR) repeat protein
VTLRSTIARGALAATVLAAAPAAAKPARPAPAPAPAPTVSAEARAEAKTLSRRAQAAFDLGEYDAAIRDFKEAYRLFPTPGLLFNLGQAHRLKGDCSGALTMYRNYLRLQPDAPHRAVVEKHIVDMEACEKEAAARAPAAPAPEPESAPAPLPAGPATDPVRSSGSGLRLAGLISAGTGAVLLAAGGYFAYDARQAERELEEDIAPGTPWRDYESIHDRGQRSELLGIGLLATGGATVVAGGVLYVLGWNGGGETPTVGIAPGASPRVTLGWGF